MDSMARFTTKYGCAVRSAARFVVNDDTKASRARCAAQASTSANVLRRALSTTSRPACIDSGTGAAQSTTTSWPATARARAAGSSLSKSARVAAVITHGRGGGGLPAALASRKRAGQARAATALIVIDV